jgi:hypothetical protein
VSRNWKKKAARGIKAAFYAAFLGLTVSLTTLSVYAEGTYQVEEVQLQGTITTDSALNVRSGPGTDCKVIAKVKNDTVLTITGKTDNGWYQVEIDGKTGFVSDKYVSASSAESDTAQEKLEKEAGEPEEGYHGLRLSPFVLKILLAVVGIVIVGAMLFATLRSLKGDEDDDDEDDDDDEAEDDDGDDDEDDDDDEEYEEELRRRKRRKKAAAAQEKKAVKEHKNEKETLKKAPKKEYVLREEDYRVQIDPSFFEEKEPIEQPAMVTGYLERKKIEEEAERQRQQKEARAAAERETEKRSQQADQKQQELDQAMQKLDELQKEIERLKNLQ